ncbi:MAG: adenine phosphoribosyltransferase [Hyphomonadaceae bacterium]|nr:adenine phosphoribosyltransferase [Hyphomonadaceae bacterium]
MNLDHFVRAIPDYPKPGILFRDITPLLGDPHAFTAVIARLAAPFAGQGVTKIVGIEARGFILGGAVAHQLGAGFAPARKPGKLPWRKHAESYALEYGMDALEMHEDAVGAGDRVLLVDDLIATGGTAGAAIALVERLGASLAGLTVVIDLPSLGGAQALRTQGVRVERILSY